MTIQFGTSTPQFGNYTAAPKHFPAQNVEQYPSSAPPVAQQDVFFGTVSPESPINVDEAFKKLVEKATSESNEATVKQEIINIAQRWIAEPNTEAQKDGIRLLLALEDEKSGKLILQYLNQPDETTPTAQTILEMLLENASTASRLSSNMRLVEHILRPQPLEQKLELEKTLLAWLQNDEIIKNETSQKLARFILSRLVFSSSQEIREACVKQIADHLENDRPAQRALLEVL